jgi:hypothetical protein
MLCPSSAGTSSYLSIDGKPGRQLVFTCMNLQGPGITVLLISWVITLYTLWQMVEMHECVRRATISVCSSDTMGERASGRPPETHATIVSTSSTVTAEADDAGVSCNDLRLLQCSSTSWARPCMCIPLSRSCTLCQIYSLLCPCFTEPSIKNSRCFKLKQPRPYPWSMDASRVLATAFSEK